MRSERYDSLPLFSIAIANRATTIVTMATTTARPRRGHPHHSHRQLYPVALAKAAGAATTAAADASDIAAAALGRTAWVRCMHWPGRFLYVGDHCGQGTRRISEYSVLSHGNAGLGSR